MLTKPEVNFAGIICQKITQRAETPHAAWIGKPEHVQLDSLDGKAKFQRVCPVGKGSIVISLDTNSNGKSSWKASSNLPVIRQLP